MLQALSPTLPVCLPQVADMSQEVRDAVGTKLLQLTLKELFNWRYMQTDPNWCAWQWPAGMAQVKGHGMRQSTIA